MDNMIDGAMNDVVETQDPSNFVSAQVHVGDMQSGEDQKIEDVSTRNYVFSDKFTEGRSSEEPNKQLF